MPDRVLLYVEDEDAAVFLMETTLRDLACNVQLHRVADGEQALSFLRKKGNFQQAPTPHLVLLDLNLPKLNGLQVLAEIQDDTTLKQIPVVIFTSSALPADKRKSMALGAKQYIIKPSTLDSFIEVVKSVVKNACAAIPGLDPSSA